MQNSKNSKIASTSVLIAQLDTKPFSDLKNIDFFPRKAG